MAVTPLALPGDVVRVNPFAKADDPAVAEAILDYSAEFEGILQRKGVTLPVTVPESFARMLKQAVVYGVAAEVEGAPVAESAGDKDTAINLFRREYLRRKAEIAALSEEDLRTLGVPPYDVAPAPQAGGEGVGFILAGSSEVILERPWYDQYPVRRAW